MAICLSFVALRNTNIESSTWEKHPFYMGSNVERSTSAGNPNDESRSDSYDTQLKREQNWNQRYVAHERNEESLKIVEE